MANQRSSDQSAKQDDSLPTADLPSQSTKEATVRHLPEAPKSPKGKRIHPRRPSPPVKDPNEQDKSPSQS